MTTKKTKEEVLAAVFAKKPVAAKVVKRTTPPKKSTLSVPVEKPVKKPAVKKPAVKKVGRSGSVSGLEQLEKIIVADAAAVKGRSAAKKAMAAAKTQTVVMAPANTTRKLQNSSLSGAHGGGQSAVIDGGKPCAIKKAAKKAADALAAPVKPAAKKRVKVVEELKDLSDGVAVEPIEKEVPLIVKAIVDAHNAPRATNGLFLQAVMQRVDEITGRVYGLFTYARLIRDALGTELPKRWTSTTLFHGAIQTELDLYTNSAIREELKKREAAEVVCVSVDRITSTMKMMGLLSKLTMGQHHANEFLKGMSVERRRDSYNLAHYLEQWRAVLDREIEVPANISQDLFTKWVDKELRKLLPDGQYAKLTFADGRAGIALGTSVYPAVLYQQNHEFVRQMDGFNPSFMKDLLKKSEFQPKISFVVNIPSFLITMLGMASDVTLNMTGVHEVFGSPMMHLSPNCLQYNLALKINQARDCLNMDLDKRAEEQERGEEQAAA